MPIKKKIPITTKVIIIQFFLNLLTNKEIKKNIVGRFNKSILANIYNPSIKGIDLLDLDDIKLPYVKEKIKETINNGIAAAIIFFVVKYRIKVKIRHNKGITK